MRYMEQRYDLLIILLQSLRKLVSVAMQAAVARDRNEQRVRVMKYRVQAIKPELLASGVGTGSVLSRDNVC